MKILSTKQFYKADAETIKNQKITSVHLMERAAQECFNWLHQNLGGSPIHIFCGIGNNGGDGLAIGRLLINHGYNVKVYIANFTDHRSSDFLINYNLIKEISSDWPILMTSEDDFPILNTEDIILDALFGIGINRPPEGWVKKLIQYLNTSEAYKIAIDIPSGLYPNKALEDEESVLKADFTLSFQNPKLAFFLPETSHFTPSFTVLDIGLDRQFLEKAQPLAKITGKYEAQEIYKPRTKFNHKGDFGYSLLIGGSYGKVGAMVLATKAALKVGAGVITAFIPKCGYTIVQTTVPEAMVITDTSEEFIENINIDFRPKAIGIGPGMGTHNNTTKALKTFLKNVQELPLVIDADALNILSQNKSLLKLIPKNSILTPHPGELKRLVGAWTDDYHKIELTKKFSEKHKVIVLIKGANSLIINKDDVYINSSGNPGMATAGSGDVLTGMITGLLSQGYQPLDAVLFGTYLHGSAGDIAASQMSYEAIIATDIIAAIGNAYLELFRNEKEDVAENEA